MDAEIDASIFRSLADKSPHGIIVLQEGRVLYANTALARLVGCPLKEIRNWDVEEALMLVLEDDREEARRRYNALITGESVTEHCELRVVPRRGPIRWVELFARIIRVHGKPFIHITVVDLKRRKQLEKGLRRTEEEFAYALESLPYPVFWAEPKTGIIINCNKAAETLLERKREEIIGRHQTTVHPPDKAEHYARMFRRHIRQRGAIDEEGEIITKTGRIKTVSITASIIHVKGKPVIQGIFRDITAYKETEEALKKSEELFRTIIETSPVFFVAIDAEGKTLLMNKHMLHTLGYTLEEVVGTDYLATFVPESEREMLSEIFRTLIKERKPTRNINRVLTKDGRELLIEWHGRPVFVKETSEFNFFFGVGIDITEQKLAEEALRASEEKYRAIFENTGTATVIIEEDTTLSMVNTEFEKLSGYSKEEVEGKKSWTDFVVEEDLERMMEYHCLRRIDEKGVPRNYEFRFRDRYGNIKDIFLTIAMIPGTKRSVASLLDITERKRAEKEIREARAQAEFFVDLMAHDLTNINQAIMSILEVMLHNPNFPAEFKQATLTALAQVKRSAQLIANVKRFSQIGTKAPKLEKRDLFPVLFAAAVTVEQAFPHKEIILRSDIQQDEYHVLADEFLFDLFYNLLHNAVKFDRRQLVVVDVDVSEASNPQFLKVEIKDRGKGISDDQKDKIFARLTPRKNGIRGTGIGLTLVRRILERYGGKIWVEDRVKGDYRKGANFVVLLPRGD